MPGLLAQIFGFVRRKFISSIDKSNNRSIAIIKEIIFEIKFLAPKIHFKANPRHSDTFANCSPPYKGASSKPNAKDMNKINDRLPASGHACFNLNIAGCGHQPPGKA